MGCVVVIACGREHLDLVQQVGQLLIPVGVEVEQKHAALVIEREFDGADQSVVGAQAVQAPFKFPVVLARQVAAVQLFERFLDLGAGKFALMKNDQFHAGVGGAWTNSL